MIRNKTNYLLHFKPRSRPGWQQQLELPPIWFEENTVFKDSLRFISAKTDEIGRLVEKLRFDRGVLLNKQIIDGVEAVQKEIRNVEKWAVTLPTQSDNSTEMQILSNMKNYYLSEVTIYVRRLNNYKNLYRSSNPPEPQPLATHPHHQTLTHPLSIHQPYLSRQQDLELVSSKIQQLNSMLRQINTMIYDQGSVIDRIDYNLQQAEGYMQKGNKELRERLDYQEGTGEWTCKGRANSCIMFLYLLNVTLMLLWLIKHLAAGKG